jgi:zinc D-Ala-D-Ala carboxypeptidase
MGDLSRNFSRPEFECSCGCGYDQIQLALVEKLQRVRDNFGPMTINSGCRCAPHNRSVGGSPQSPHLQGLGVDIRSANSLSRFNLIRSLLDVGFKRIGIGQEFIHVDQELSKPQSLMWLC